MMVQNGQYKLGIEKRITTLESNYMNMDKKIDEVNAKLDTFMNNHFEHFKDDVFKAINNAKGVPISITIMIGMLSTLVTGLIMWVVTK